MSAVGFDNRAAGMATGLFETFTLAEVQEIQAKAKSLLMEGKTIMNYSDSGTNVGKQFAMPIREVLEECNHALRKLDPETYGTAKRSRSARIDYRYNSHL